MSSPCRVEPQKQTKSGLKTKWREFRPCRLHFSEAKRPHSTQRVGEVHQKFGESSVHAGHNFSKQNGRTIPGETERCIEKLARVPSMQITFFRGKTAAQYPACQRGASKHWREFRPCRSHFSEAKRPHSIQRVRKVHQKNARVPFL